MSNDVHERARKLALRARIEGPATVDREWLEAHLSTCPACREYHESLDRALGAVRALAPTAGDALVRRTQVLVRQRAAELCGRNAMMRPLWIACGMVVLTSLVFTPLLWQVCAWIGRIAHLSELTWRAGFVLFWIAPALAASVLLLGSGYVTRWREPQISIGGEA